MTDWLVTRMPPVPPAGLVGYYMMLVACPATHRREHT